MRISATSTVGGGSGTSAIEGYNGTTIVTIDGFDGTTIQSIEGY
jgi:hypothetical protein